MDYIQGDINLVTMQEFTMFIIYGVSAWCTYVDSYMHA